MLKYPYLFSPVKVGNVLFRNRIFETPMSGFFIRSDHTAGENAAEFYARRARGGAACVCVGECHVDIPRGTRGGVHMDMFDQATLIDLANMADMIRRHGAAASVELVHYGRYATSGLGPSDGIASGRQIRAYTPQEIEEILDAFARAALNAKSKGFDMVTIHGAHGWLPQQFFSEYTNTRTDEWGGSAAKRARFAVEICDRIHALCGRNFPVEFRISGTELSQGYGMEGGIEYAKALDGHADIIHVSAGVHGDLSNDEWLLGSPGIFDEDGPLLKYAAAIKKEMKHSLVGTVGGVADPALMEEYIASGKVDIINCGRALMCDPDLPNKAREGRDEDIRMCMRCMGCWSNLMTMNKIVCAINPETGREAEFSGPMEAKIKKNVAVVGGGIAGIQAALTAAQCGHSVTLYEKNAFLGGNIHCEENVPFKKRFRRYLDLQIRSLEKAGVKVLLGTEADPELFKETKPDVILACVGTRPLIPPIPGIDGRNVVTGQYAFGHPDKLGRKAAIIGGGLVGCELSIYLGMLGIKTEVIEMGGKINAAGMMFQGKIVSRELRARNMEVRFNSVAKKITEEGLYYESGGEEKFIEADTVIVAAGQRPLTDAALAFADCAPQFHMIGDCAGGGNIMTAVKNAYTIARDL
ncbi:MAG: FAD-dependent oxidoreductase [Firmicutes bacterium]|nr:FAD-dependent oxidoreductase [Bacillota bacterium]